MIAAALKAKWMELRKAKDPMAASLGLVQSNANEFAKKDNPAAPVVTDEHALRAIRAASKRLDEVIQLIGERGGDDSAEVAERDLLNGLLPAQASEEDVRDSAVSYIQGRVDAGDARNMKLMGPTLKALEEKYGAALDKARASAIVKAALSA